jgi:cytochrome c oxidase subunit 2
MYLASRKIIDSVDNAWYWLGGISLVLFIGIMGVLIYFVIKYHRSRHPKSEHIPGNFKLEVIWTVLPTMLSIWLFFVGLEGFQLMRDPPEDAYIIEVEGVQWQWNYTYPKEGVSSKDYLYVPVNTPVKLNLSSPIGDVLHSFYLPDFRVKEDCVPGTPTYLWFEADRVTARIEDGEIRGTWHNVFCAEFCGKDHAKMISRMYVLPKEDFEAWLDGRIADRYRPVTADDAMDRESLADTEPATLYQTYCVSCHGAGGEGGLVEGARDFRTLEKWKPEPYGPKITGIFRTLTLGIEGAQMRAFDNLSARERFALAYYVADFYKGDDRPQSTREEFEELVTEFSLDKPRKVKRDFRIDETIEQMATEAEAGD